MRIYHLIMLATTLVVLTPRPAWAYIGPGAGFALAGSFLAMSGAFLSALSMLLLWPLRRLASLMLCRRPPGKARFKRVVILGLDGFDHKLTARLLAEGKLPNLETLRKQGDFKSLASTLPPISPVAWSSFQTGVNPGKHNIFDFLKPDERTYQPKLSSVDIRTPTRTVHWGPFRLPGSKADVRILRKSRPFWSILSDYGVFSSIIRVPVTFPPEKLRGVQLSAMCVPDLRGTQGTFSHYTTRPPGISRKTGGEVHYVARAGNSVSCELLGPTHPNDPHHGPLILPFRVTCNVKHSVQLTINGETHAMVEGEYTGWIQVVFRGPRGVKIRGICRFLLLSTEPEFELYVTPVNIDPETPAMTIGYPPIYPVYLAKRQGVYATLGLAEDTWALNEQVLDDRQFLQQCLDIEREREAMFFDSLEKTPRGLCVCVFDGPDRIQHMFWRHLGGRRTAMRHPHASASIPTTIADAYCRMDKLVGRTRAKCQRDDTLLIVLSDHGFTSFRRGVDLNRWLETMGYLVLDDERRNEEHLRAVDWSRTRAFAIGLAGIFINRKGKFSQGIVEDGVEADRLRQIIAQQLTQLIDPMEGHAAVSRVYESSRSYSGPYQDHAPDLIVGYASGYRVAWDTAIGRTSRTVFHDNTRSWSGDHCVDPALVPGVLFCNRRIESAEPRLIDLAPTILEQFGVPVPNYMDGQALLIGAPADLSADTVVAQRPDVF